MSDNAVRRLKKEDMKNSLQYCESLVRRHEEDQYLCAMLAPEGTWAPLMTLRAFNIETATVRESTTNETTAAIRLQWWRDSLEDIYSGTPGDSLKQPVLAMIYVLLHRHYLPKELFMDILDARDEDLVVGAMETMEDLLKYSDMTQGRLLELALHTLTIHASDFPNAAKAALHAGRFLGLTTMIRATPFLAARNQTYVPKKMLDEQIGFSPEEFYASLLSGKTPDPMKECIREMVTVARQELDQARELHSNVTRDTSLMLLSVLPALHYIERLQANDYELCSPDVMQLTGFGPLKLRLRLRWCAWRGNF